MTQTIQVKRLVLISLFASILFIQEQALLFLPNISLTILLLLVYTKYFNLKEMFLIIVIYTFIDSLFYGGINLYYYLFTILAWFTVSVIFKFSKKENITKLSIIAFFCAIVYSLIVMIPAIYLTKVNFIAYFIADFPFEMMLGLSSFLTVIILYERLITTLDKFETLNKRT